MKKYLCPVAGIKDPYLYPAANRRDYNIYVRTCRSGTSSTRTSPSELCIRSDPAVRGGGAVALYIDIVATNRDAHRHTCIHGRLTIPRRARAWRRGVALPPSSAPSERDRATAGFDRFVAPAEAGRDRSIDRATARSLGTRDRLAWSHASRGPRNWTGSERPDHGSLHHHQ